MACTKIISDVQFASSNQMYPEFLLRENKLYVALFSIPKKKKKCSFIFVQVFIMIRTKPPHFSHLAHHMEGVVLVHTTYQVPTSQKALGPIEWACYKQNQTHHSYILFLNLLEDVECRN